MQLSFCKDGSVEKVAELTVAVFQGRRQLGEVHLLVVRISRWFGSMKSRNCLVVTWDRVESLRDRSRGAIIGALGYNADRCNKPGHGNNMRTDHWN